VRNSPRGIVPALHHHPKMVTPRFHFAPGVIPPSLACASDSLVRVSRRAAWGRYAGVTRTLEVCPFEITTYNKAPVAGPPQDAITETYYLRPLPLARLKGAFSPWFPQLTRRHYRHQVASKTVARFKTLLDTLPSSDGLTPTTYFTLDRQGI
jgi:hypothetical protein